MIFRLLYDFLLYIPLINIFNINNNWLSFIGSYAKFWCGYSKLKKNVKVHYICYFSFDYETLPKVFYILSQCKWKTKNI